MTKFSGKVVFPRKRFAKVSFSLTIDVLYRSIEITLIHLLRYTALLQYCKNFFLENIAGLEECKTGCCLKSKVKNYMSRRTNKSKVQTSHDQNLWSLFSFSDLILSTKRASVYYIASPIDGI